MFICTHVCVNIELHITPQSRPDMLTLVCYSYGSSLWERLMGRRGRFMAFSRLGIDPCMVTDSALG